MVQLVDEQCSKYTGFFPKAPLRQKFSPDSPAKPWAADAIGPTLNR